MRKRDWIAFLCLPALLLQVLYTWGYWTWHIIVWTAPRVVFLPPPLVIEAEIFILYPWFVFGDVYVSIWIYAELYRKKRGGGDGS